MSYLLDTDICSAFIKGNRQVWSKVMQHIGQLHVSAITAAELYAWGLRINASATRLQALLDFFDDVVFLGADRIISRKYGEVRSKQLDAGKITPQMDLLIASTALAHGLTLATHNIQDFEDIPDLRVEDWLAT